jgi:geranylgeranyl diphosphate synthase type I
MDRDETRRGRPTVWTLWGEGQAINAGDALFALAQLALLRLSERDVPAVTTAAALRLFNRDWLTTAGGQYLDMTFENRANVSVQEYLRMVEGKTSLVPCACEMGALVAAAPDIQRERLRSFGFHLGLVFQITDDVLGIWGDPALSGKPVGADIARRKKSLPILHGLEQSAELQALLARRQLSADDVQHATRLLEETGSRAFAEQLAQEHYDSAMTALKEANLHETPFCALCEIAQKLLHRQK